MADPEHLSAQAERIRASGVLGRSPLMQRLFDFLLDRSLSGKAPKEIEVAVDAFGKGPDFDVSQDAMVRVYVHKLRRKLEEFYAGPGAGEAVRLSIPKGEYRFAAEAAEAVPEPAAAPAVAAPPAHRKWILRALIVSLLINAGVLLTAWLRPSGPVDELSTLRQSPLWSPLLHDERTIFLVVGDYYIFGETDESMEVKRLVREFDINSPQDLDHHLKLHPDLADRYMDLELAYLPTAAAYALRDLMPLLSSANKRVRVVTMSQLNPTAIKSADVVYVGYLSGLGMLRDLAFSASRLSFGESYDEIVDRNTKRRYVSQAGAPYPGENKIHDYGYFATFTGPTGNHIVIIAGTRDVAAMHMAEIVTEPRTLATLVKNAGAASSYEALYEVYGMDRLNLDGKLLLTSPLDSASIWSGSHDPEIGSAPDRVRVETP
jgi:hypothetical protein